MDRWAQTISIITNLGVIAGLVMVGVEISQNSEMLRITAARESTASIVETVTQQMDTDVALTLAKAFDGEPLSISEVVVLEGYLFPLLLIIQDDYIDFQRGVYSEERWRSRAAFVRAIFLTEATRKWWHAFKVSFTEQFQQYVDAEIAVLPVAPIKYSDLVEGTPIPVD